MGAKCSKGYPLIKHLLKLWGRNFKKMVLTLKLGPLLP